MFAATNVSLAASHWTSLAAATEIGPGQFRFTAPATNRPAHFYQIRSP